MDRGVWWATVHGVAESDTIKDFHYFFNFFRWDFSLLTRGKLEKSKMLWTQLYNAGSL